MPDPPVEKRPAGLLRGVGRGWAWYKNLLAVVGGVWGSAYAIDAAWSANLGEVASPPARIWIVLPFYAVALILALPLLHFLVNSLVRVAAIAAAPGLLIAGVILAARGAPEYGVIVAVGALYLAAIALVVIPAIEAAADEA